MRLLRLTKRRLPASITGVGHLLLVGGPSGAGKSTFLEKLARGELPAGINERLPAGAEGWMQTDGNKIVRNEDALDGGTDLGGACLHYDILRPFASPIGRYDGDAALRMLEVTENVILVMVSAPPEQLAEQLLARSRGGAAQGSAMRWREQVVATLPPWLRDGAAALVDSRRCRDRATWLRRHLVIAERYRQEGWIDQWYLRWGRYLHGAVGGRLRRPVMHVRPVLTEQRRPSFEIADMHEMFSPTRAPRAAVRPGR